VPTRILLYGLGAIGRAVAQAAATRRDITVTAAVDLSRAGEDLGQVAGAWPGVVVHKSLREALASAAVDCVIHATSSRLIDIVPQLLEIVDAGLSVVSSAEELLVPSAIDPALTRTLDQRAAAQGVSIVAAGVNPGLVMDALPVLVASACVRVDAIRVRRVVDLARRREQLQQKLGVGMSPEDFVAARDAGKGGLGHVGLGQSMEAIARALDVEVEVEEHGLEPIVRGGRVIGADEWRLGKGQGLRVELRLRMEMTPAQEYDEVVVEGDPPVRLRIDGGVHGDRATVGKLLNAVRYARKVQGLNPGTLW
jgi:2,4-diaminopentanoate dehydrogenase